MAKNTSHKNRKMRYEKKEKLRQKLEAQKKADKYIYWAVGILTVIAVLVAFIIF